MLPRGSARSAVIVAAVVLVGGCGTFTPSEKIHEPPAGATLGTGAASTARAAAASAPPTKDPAATTDLPAGDQWVGSRTAHVRFAVPATWVVVDPTKFGGSAAFASSPVIKELATRMGISTQAFVAQMKGINVMAIYPGRVHANAALTTTPLSQMPSDAALDVEIGTVSGHPESVHIAHRRSLFGDMAVAQYTTTVAGLPMVLRSHLAMFVVQGQVCSLEVTSSDASSADRAFNEAVATLSRW